MRLDRVTNYSTTVPNLKKYRSIQKYLITTNNSKESKYYENYILYGKC